MASTSFFPAVGGEAERGDGEEEEEEWICATCGCEEPPRRLRPRGATEFAWTQCDGSTCQRWFHNCCIRGPAPSGDGDDEWFCEDCVAAAPDEEDTDTLEPEN